ncbi:MAG: fumarylacetoacetate hydrolase family protein, partial [Paramuribaculum sp.]|nr:fumarylacetoacetate hydrolase family protein [Paramuribaculum sp.]
IEIIIQERNYLLTKEMIDIQMIIESVSHYTTLKTGDVILPCELPQQFNVQAGDDVRIEVVGFPKFDFKIR